MLFNHGLYSESDMISGSYQLLHAAAKFGLHQPGR
jgi:hypothetical protein